MLSFEPSVIDYNAVIVVQVLISVGALIMMLMLGAFFVALFQEWKVVKAYTQQKKQCKFFESLSNIKSRTR